MNNAVDLIEIDLDDLRISAIINSGEDIGDLLSSGDLDVDDLYDPKMDEHSHTPRPLSEYIFPNFNFNPNDQPVL